MTFEKITESESKYSDLENKSLGELLTIINREDQTVAFAVEKVIPFIERATEAIVRQMKTGGRLFYIGAGTSGRLGIVDASECPPTFGVSDDWVIGLIAGGDAAIRNAVENAEDYTENAVKDLQAYHISEKDFVVGIAASGSTPYVVGGLQFCRENKIPTACITCNPGSPVTKWADFPIVAVVGSEVITGSSRMKAGTAQKLILNMISTAVMIQLGRVKGNKMVDMKLSNNKLVNRAERMLMDELGIDTYTAKALIEKHRNVREAIKSYRNE